MKALLGDSKTLVGYLTSIIGVALVMVLLAPFHESINHTTISLALLLVVLVIATIFGSRPALLASFLGILSFNFFFLPPLYNLAISEPENWVAFGAFIVTAIITGQLSSYARRRTQESEERRKEIERLYNELQGAFEQASQAEALRRSEQLKSALLDAVTHDLRTPLTSIKASATTLLEDSRGKLNEPLSFDNETVQLDDEGRNEFLEIINEEADRLNKFIEGMVNLAKIEAGELHLHKNWSSVEEIINTAMERAKIRLESHNISVQLENALPVISIDANSIAEVVYNLLDNAAKYSPKESKVRILACRVRNDTIEFAVEDCGRGIPKESRETIFKKFYRMSEKKIPNTSNGLGLGLAIARGIIESQGGKIWVEDGKDGYKTRFAFQIPIDNNEERLGQL